MRRNQKSYFNTMVRANRKQLEWIKRNMDTRTMAGFLDKLINVHKSKMKKNKQKVTKEDAYGL